MSDHDHLRLGRLVTDAAVRVDTGMADTLHELFADDGVLDLGEEALHGRNAIRAWGQVLVADDTYAGIRHVAGNMRFFERGTDEAEGVTLLTVYFDAAGAGGTSVPWVVGEDHDRFVRADGGWLFASRQFIPLFVRPVQGTL